MLVNLIILIVYGYHYYYYHYFSFDFAKFRLYLMCKCHFLLLILQSIIISYYYCTLYIHFFSKYVYHLKMIKKGIHVFSLLYPTFPIYIYLIISRHNLLLSFFVCLIFK